MSIYGILISTSILIAVLLSQSLLPKNEKDNVWDLAIWIIVTGILGARIYHVLSDLEYYLSNPIQILEIYKGGLAYYGGIFGGFAGLYLFSKKKNLNLKKYVDVILTVIPLSHAVGRFGNYFNQEAYGLETTLPWGIYIDNKKVHPLFMYESFLNIINFLILYILVKKNKKLLGTGIPAAIYFINYGLIRFVLEYLRPVSWTLWNLNVAQAISILLFIYGSIYIVRSWRIQSKKQTGSTTES